MDQSFKQDREYFDGWVKEYMAHRRFEANDVSQLIDSIDYSLFNGGKRFRPLLCFALAEALGIAKEKVVAFAGAVEMVHTYSLIHDDLPCMDDDNERRGQPTNHIKFNEEVALLAGDSLLTEAFQVLARNYTAECGLLVQMVAEGAGLNGMIRGQVLDLGQGQPINELGDLINLHELKTGRLIAMCCSGPAVIAGKKSNPFYELGLMLGLAFQVKDDLLDAEEEDNASFITFLGVDGTESYLESLTEKINGALKELSLESPYLKNLIDYNLKREK